ncbi:MAG: DUF2905 domain-containing protein [Candidatus Aureabacteria bacterium]|nr:DUF2905 domain-containing protein [Candidatus Auribacterota bacterium]
MDLRILSKPAIVTGICLIILGAALSYSDKIPFLGKLPGDIHIKKENFTFYFPFAACVLLSIVISVVLWLIRKR